jgi:hypothetical protein
MMAELPENGDPAGDALLRQEVSFQEQQIAHHHHEDGEMSVAGAMCLNLSLLASPRHYRPLLLVALSLTSF